MLILLIILTILLVWVTYDIMQSEILPSVFIVTLVIELISLICCIALLIETRVIDEKIELYETQNQEIEEKIEVVVKEYMDYEGETLQELKSDSYITLVNLYPELKADDMIQQQINLYMNNNSTITHLKEKRIKKTIYKWWIYFGK